MDDYKGLIANLTEAANRNSNSLNTRDTCRKAADAIEQLMRERDTAIHDLDMAVCGHESYPCRYCTNYGISPVDVDDVCKTCTDYENWEWRGAE